MASVLQQYGLTHRHVCKEFISFKQSFLLLEILPTFTEYSQVLSVKKKGIIIIFSNLLQRPKPAVQRRSSVLDHICVSLSVGSVMETKTVLTGLTRASKLAVVRAGWGLKTFHKERRKSILHRCNRYLPHSLPTYVLMSQCSTTRATATSSCARTDSASPSTLCVTMITTAAMAQMSPRSVVSDL